MCRLLSPLVQEKGPESRYDLDSDEPDAHVAAWGVAHDDGSDQVTAVDGGFWMSLRTPDRAAQLISLHPGSIGCLVRPGPITRITPAR